MKTLKYICMWFSFNKFERIVRIVSRILWYILSCYTVVWLVVFSTLYISLKYMYDFRCFSFWILNLFLYDFTLYLFFWLKSRITKSVRLINVTILNKISINNIKYNK